MQVGWRGALALILWLGVLTPGIVLASPRVATGVAAAPQQTPSRGQDESPGPCSAGAIRLAAAKQTTPALTGCRYDVVAGPVAQFFLTLPVARKTDDQAALGTIVAQSPAAGQPLKPGGRLVLNVSTGRPPKAEEEVPANPAAESQSSASSSSTEPVPGRPTVPAAEPEPQPEPAQLPEQPVAPPAPVAPQPPQVAPTDRPDAPERPEAPTNLLPGIPWPWIAGALALVILLGVAVTAALKPGGSRGGGLIAPAVSLRLVPGEARLKTRGSLVSGRKG